MPVLKLPLDTATSYWIEEMTVLVLTVGGSHQPLVTAAQSLKPDRVVFLCSDDTPTARGSYEQVIGEGKVIKSNPQLEKPDLPNIVKLTGLTPSQYEIVRIKNFDSLVDCYLEARKVLGRVHREEPGDRVIADYTGGTKTMTAGLALAAVDDERCEINLVTGTRPDLEKVQDKTEFARPIVVWDLRGRRSLEEAKVRLSRYDYAGAADLMEAIGRIPISEDLRQKITIGIAICRGLDAWDRFSHKEARELLEPYRKYLVQECIMLDDLCRDQPKDPYIYVEDLLFNAERRATQGRYDDATARIYRALEMIVQIRLRTKYEIDTSDVDLAKVPEQRQKSLEHHRSEDGKLRVPLFAAWTLVPDMGDEVLGAWFAKNKGKIQDFLGSRNLSILAHGNKPIDKAEYQSRGMTGILLCQDALANIPKDERKIQAVRQLPQSLRILETSE